MNVLGSGVLGAFILGGGASPLSGGSEGATDGCDYWINGVPVLVRFNEAGTMKYWQGGKVADVLTAAEPVPPVPPAAINNPLIM